MLTLPRRFAEERESFFGAPKALLQRHRVIGEGAQGRTPLPAFGVGAPLQHEVSERSRRYDNEVWLVRTRVAQAFLADVGIVQHINALRALGNLGCCGRTHSLKGMGRRVSDWFGAAGTVHWAARMIAGGFGRLLPFVLMKKSCAVTFPFVAS